MVRNWLISGATRFQDKYQTWIVLEAGEDFLERFAIWDFVPLGFQFCKVMEKIMIDMLFEAASPQ